MQNCQSICCCKYSQTMDYIQCIFGVGTKENMICMYKTFVLCFKPGTTCNISQPWALAREPFSGRGCRWQKPGQAKQSVNILGHQHSWNSNGDIEGAFLACCGGESELSPHVPGTNGIRLIGAHRKISRKRTEGTMRAPSS